MKKNLFLTAIIIIVSIGTTKANSFKNNIYQEIKKDSARLSELDKFWTELSRTVREGDFEGYQAAYHPDAVLVIKQNRSISITEALDNWKQGFIDTKLGKKNDKVEFRLSKRIGSKTTAFETGIFYFTSTDSHGNPTEDYIHFEMLLVKRNEKWYALMENQKSEATKEEWKALE
ncbi:nuclear transport factor 2 family protein [Wenyingzhuangia sp. chi5]|uniref:Nuclear transport factor 2 family protein n=1 Tax=Wenyingzhuangia gilva TaxID=3057677 RepID=A0ABT8VS41_9FLAO|nr:nuclear transport factor 2 family protein [Wenyingzhuangia sp. chi5]MDO3694789.1 nuclear transport factor 2 family protein [Wenyingzhuangia sp. chi5]